MSFYDGKVIPLSEDDRVANVVGSSKDRVPPSPSTSWKNFWEVSVASKSRRKWPHTCQFYGCGNDATMGAHVYIATITTNKFFFILPSCGRCNADPERTYDRGWSSAKEDAWVVATTVQCCLDASGCRLKYRG